MEIVLAIVIGALCIVSFITGAKVGQAVRNGETVQVLPDPIKAVRDQRVEREAEKERKRMETILSNIESYDGTGMGQKDVL
jgi:hypothetical protein